MKTRLPSSQSTGKLLHSVGCTPAPLFETPRAADVVVDTFVYELIRP